VFLYHLADPLPWLAATGAEVVARLRGRPELFNLDKIREASVPSWASSMAAVHEDLGFTPSRTVEQRMLETVQWYQQRGWL
jgi:hypothetical protein